MSLTNQQCCRTLPLRQGDQYTRVEVVVGRLYIAILGMLVVGVILVVQLAQGETGWLHWFGLGAVVIGLISLLFEMKKVRQR